jgi:tRNA (cytidine/uridine-2'-O-)-methyltransferase
MRHSTGCTDKHVGARSRIPEMLYLILYEPEIPPNTGNIIRLCANTGVALHLIEPLGFDLEERKLRRAGLDYREFASVTTHSTLVDCLSSLNDPRVFAISTRGKTRYDAPQYRDGDALLLGPETRGLPTEVMEALPAEQRLRLPMRSGSRSLNLSNAAAIVVYEAWRQLGFDGGV